MIHSHPHSLSVLYKDSEEMCSSIHATECIFYFCIITWKVNIFLWSYVVVCFEVTWEHKQYVRMKSKSVSTACYEDTRSRRANIIISMKVSSPNSKASSVEQQFNESIDLCS